MKFPEVGYTPANLRIQASRVAAGSEAQYSLARSSSVTALVMFWLVVVMSFE